MRGRDEATAEGDPREGGASNEMRHARETTRRKRESAAWKGWKGWGGGTQNDREIEREAERGGEREAREEKKEEEKETHRSSCATFAVRGDVGNMGMLLLRVGARKTERCYVRLSRGRQRIGETSCHRAASSSFSAF